MYLVNKKIIKNKIIRYNKINGDIFPFLTDLKKITGRVLGRIIGLNLSPYFTVDAIANSSVAMDAIVKNTEVMDMIINSSVAMNAIANSSVAMDKIINSSIFIDKITSSSVAMDEIVRSPTAINNIINSAVALYYICINNPQGKGLKKLASNIEGTTTINWENDDKWQTIYNTLSNAPDLFTKSYILDICDVCDKNRKGDLITLIVSCYSINIDGHFLSVSPRYSGCYSHGYTYNWSTGKHIMWGGHSSSHDVGTANCSVRHYMFTPIT